MPLGCLLLVVGFGCALAHLTQTLLLNLEMGAVLQLGWWGWLAEGWRYTYQEMGAVLYMAGGWRYAPNLVEVHYGWLEIAFHIPTYLDQTLALSSSQEMGAVLWDVASLPLGSDGITENGIVKVDIRWDIKETLDGHRMDLLARSQSGFLSRTPLSLLDTPDISTQIGISRQQNQFNVLNKSQSFSHNTFFSHASQHQQNPVFMRAHMIHGTVYEAKINDLQNELTKVTTERDTIKAAFHTLASVLKLPDDMDPLTFSLTDIDSQMTVSKDKGNLREKYPKIHFWSRSDYEAFALSPEAQGIDHRKAPWLELENGNPVTAKTLKAIHASTRSIWAKLTQCQIAPLTWTRISSSAKALVSKYMLKEHPLLGLDKDRFKLEMLCINDYSGWHKNHLTPSSEVKDMSSRKSKPKEESKEEPNDMISPLATKGHKHKSDPAHSMNTHMKWSKGAFLHPICVVWADHDTPRNQYCYRTASGGDPDRCVNSDS
ncbi:hypothetical protein BKA82DRAFT_10738 [Pisolithus tinctorius]|uniref:Uncharacterized protein n=1 Tax=Pisolithus tinctorius Marx 270 TaxID=870435 RepID=A0A0C3NPJ5_PISTI|nr:hypothetical protein BKA82DRAFT_10738 [Pisolithus tinctorius]KIN97495.1 hypothetical protein M404DRAFT_10738 [Pisolithus tinctorius Marx 270]